MVTLEHMAENHLLIQQRGIYGNKPIPEKRGFTACFILIKNHHHHYYWYTLTSVGKATALFLL